MPALHIPEESLFLANEMHGQMSSVCGNWLLSKGLGLWPGRVFLGTMGPWKHMDRTGWGRGVDRNGGSLAAHGGERTPWHGPLLPNGSEYFLGGLGSPLAGQAGSNLAVGSQDLSGMGRTRRLPYPGASPQMS